MMYALEHVNLIDGTEAGGLRPNQTILVVNGRISKILPGGAPLPEGCERIALAGKYLMPGLINLHAHLFGSGKPSKVLGGGGLQRAVIRFATSKAGQPVLDGMVKKSVQAALHSGVTTIRGVGDFCFSDVRVRDRINAGELEGPRLLVSGPAITPVGGHGDGTFGRSTNDPAQMAALAQDNAAHRVDLIKICVTGGVMDARVKGEPGEVKMTLEQTRTVCAKAHALGYRVASHTESTEGVRLALEGGVDTIEHGSALDGDCLRLFQEKRAALVVTLSPALPLARLSPKITRLDELCVFNSEVVLSNMVEGAKKQWNAAFRWGWARTAPARW